jgi:BirA family transcriptional regulator, biotin operon repressor / biotin---[acetyl-CoA-carboxylase] ligase
LRTLFTGQSIIELEEVDSTNNYAFKLLANEAIYEGTLIIANKQTSGKGQRGNEWLSEAGKNLTCSYIMNPKFLPPEKGFYITIITALAVNKVLRDLKIPSLIKWPNDIITENGYKKICGILTESIIKRNSIETVVIGIGLNVNQKEFSLSDCSSIILETNQETDLKDIIPQLSQYLEFYYLRLKSGNYEYLLEEYYKHLLGLNEYRTFINLEEERFQGIIRGINEYGSLLIETNQNEILSFGLKEIQFVFE